MAAALLKEFADETGIFGLHIFAKLHSRFEVAFWGIFVVVLGGYTTRTLYDVCTRYADEEVITNVQRQRLEQFIFPSPTLELFGSRHMPRGAIDGRVLDIIAQYLETQTLNISDVFVAVDFVNHIRSLERVMANPKQVGSAITIPEITRKALEALALRSWSLTAFADIASRTLCLGFGLVVTFDGRSSSGNASKTTIQSCLQNRVWITGAANTAHIYVDLDEVRFPFTLATDALQITFNTTAIRDALGFDVEKARFHVDFGDVDESDSRIVIQLGWYRRYYVRPIAVYRNLNLRRRPCDARRNLYDCSASCKSQYFFDAWGCWPWSRAHELVIWHRNETGLRRCEAADFLNFTVPRAPFTKPAAESLAQCQDGCIPSCTSQILSTTGDSIEAQGDTSASFVVPSFVCLLVEEQMATNFEGFLAEFGGTLGLWLGASFAAVVHIPVFVVQSIVHIGWKRCKKKKQVIPAAFELQENIEGFDSTVSESVLTRLSDRVRQLEDANKSNVARVAILEKFILRQRHSSDDDYRRQKF